MRACCKTQLRHACRLYSAATRRRLLVFLYVCVCGGVHRAAGAGSSSFYCLAASLRAKSA